MTKIKTIRCKTVYSREKILKLLQHCNLCDKNLNLNIEFYGKTSKYTFCLTQKDEDSRGGGLFLCRERVCELIDSTQRLTVRHIKSMDQETLNTVGALLESFRAESIKMVEEVLLFRQLELTKFETLLKNII